jgi:hypothetical protein
VLFPRFEHPGVDVEVVDEPDGLDRYLIRKGHPKLQVSRLTIISEPDADGRIGRTG